MLIAVGAVALPTAIRAAVSGTVTGCEFTPYLPFVFLCAVLIRWWQAGIVALACIAVLGGLLGGSPAARLPCFIPAAGIFIASSAVMIGIANLIRRTIEFVRCDPVDDSAGGIVFSLEKGEVWASWYGHGLPVRLGTQRKVSEMMEDFLAQAKVAKRLNRK